MLTSLYLLLALAATGAALAQTIDPAAVILTAQKNAIVNWADFASGNKISGWDAASPVCSWTAVQCDAAGLVTSIDLGCNRAGAVGSSPQFCATKALGTLAPELAGLNSLVSLSLNGQSFIGPLPATWGSGFPQLTTLELRDNALTGTIPESWAAGSFASLSNMDLQGNTQLCGPVPASLLAAVCGMDGSRCSGGSLGACLGPAPAPPSAAPGLPAAYDFGAPGPANPPSGNVSAGVGGRFESPAYNGIPIDACLTFGRDCGKPAADYFCTLAGYPSAFNFSDPVFLPPAGTIQVDTILPSEMSVCSTFFQLCQTFAWIQCSLP